MTTHLSRRSFLGASAALAALRGSAFSAPPEGGTSGVKVGVATYSLRHFSRPQALDILKKLDVHYVSIKEFHLRYILSPAEVAAGAKEFRDAGFTILSGGNIGLDKPDELKKMFEYAKAAGMPMMVCAPSHETLPAVEKLVKEYNIKAAIHNHGPEDKNFPTPQSVLEAVKNMDPRMGLCVDIGHTSAAGADVVESLRLAGKRLFDVHMKDLKDARQSDTQVPVGEGALPIAGIYKQLKKMGYTGGTMLEYEAQPENPVPGMEKSLAYMRKVVAEVGA